MSDIGEIRVPVLPVDPEFEKEVDELLKAVSATGTGVMRMTEKGIKHVPAEEIFQVQPDPEPFDFKRADELAAFHEEQAIKHSWVKELSEYHADNARLLRDAIRRLK